MTGFLSDKAMEGLSKQIIGVKRTRHLDDLAKWYSLGDVSINPTMEDNFQLYISSFWLVEFSHYIWL